MQKYIGLSFLTMFLYACPTKYGEIPEVELVNLSGRDLVAFLNRENPGDSNLTTDLDYFTLNSSPFPHLNAKREPGGIAAYFVCAWSDNPYDAHTIRECIDFQPAKRIYYFVFDPDTIDYYGLSRVVRENNYIYRGYVDSNSEFSDIEERVTSYYP